MENVGFAGKNRLSGQRPIVIVGGCHMDVLGRPSGRFEPATSCPGEVWYRPGGVARNVATLVGRAGAVAAFASVVGDDASGRELVSSLAAAGVDVSGVATAPGRRTGTYLAIHDDDGEMIAAVSDLWIYDDFVLPPALLTAGAEPVVFADANIPVAALTALAERHGRNLVVDAISRAKAPKLLPLLGHGSTVVCNLPSVARLVGFEASRPREAAEALRRLGARAAVITGGAQPIAVLDGEALDELVPEPVAVADVTGVGDAQIAGTLLGLACGRDLRAAVAVGMLGARAALATHGALGELPPAVFAALGLAD